MTRLQTKQRRQAKPKTKGRAPREAPPPSNWARSRQGKLPVEVVLVRSERRDGMKLYRLRYLQNVDKNGNGLVGATMWTLAELREIVRFVKSKPKVLAERAAIIRPLPMTREQRLAASGDAWRSRDVPVTRAEVSR